MIKWLKSKLKKEVKPVEVEEGTFIPIIKSTKKKTTKKKASTKVKPTVKKRKKSEKQKMKEQRL